MISIEHKGYFPLTEEHLIRCVPPRPGVYVLAIELSNGVHQIFYTSQTENLHYNLSTLLAGGQADIPEIVTEYLRKHLCYFTYFVIPHAAYRHEIEKLLATTADPIKTLTIIEAR
jgi:hypothetical protein